MVRSAVIASSSLAILRSNHARSTSARNVEGDSAEGGGALRHRTHRQLRDFPSSRCSVGTARSAAVARTQPPGMSPNTGGPSSDDPAPKATARQILRVMRHRSLLVRKEADISAQLSSWPTQQLRMELTQEPLRVLVQHMRPTVKPVRSIEKFCGVLMTLLVRVRILSWLGLAANLAGFPRWVCECSYVGSSGERADQPAVYSRDRQRG